MRVFVTGTSKGEVKIWATNTDCTLLGVLNNPNLNPWDKNHIMGFVG